MTVSAQVLIKQTASEMRRRGWSRSGRHETRWPFLQHFSSAPVRGAPSMDLAARRGHHALETKNRLRRVALGTLHCLELLTAGRFVPVLARRAAIIGATCFARRDAADPRGPKAHCPPPRGEAYLWKRSEVATNGGARKGLQMRPTCRLTPAPRLPPGCVSINTQVRRIQDEPRP